MEIGVIGGGGVGQTLGAALAAQGHRVTLGIRNPSPEELARERRNAQTLSDWQAATGARVTTMAAAAAAGEVIINATEGTGSLAALALAGADNLAGKVLIDVANPLDFSQGMPPFLPHAFTGTTSLGEQIQVAFPKARVVKAFNTIAAAVMIQPGLIPGDHDLFIAGNDADAKATVMDIARSFGWQHFVDLGDIVGARASEAVLPVWARLWQTGGSPVVNLRVVRG